MDDKKRGPSYEEHQQALALLHQMISKNDGDLQALAREGVQIAHDSLTSARLAMLLDMLLGPLGERDGTDVTTPERLAYELQCQQRFTKMIEDVQQQVRLQRLTQGVNANMPIIHGNGNANGGGLIH